MKSDSVTCIPLKALTIALAVTWAVLVMMDWALCHSRQEQWFFIPRIVMMVFVLTPLLIATWLIVFHAMRTWKRALDQKVAELQDEAAERKQVEEKLRTLRRAVEQSSNTIVIADAEGRITYANPQYKLLTGYTRGEVYGKNPRMLNSRLHPPEFYKNLWRTISSGQQWRGEFVNRRKDGTLYWEDACITPVFDDHGNISQYVAVKDDITERKRIENDLTKAREAAEAANRSKSEFLANMSQKIRTPMTALLGFSEVLLESEMDGEQFDAVATINRNCEHLLKIINDILDLSEIEEGKLEFEHIHMVDHMPGVVRVGW